ncbi:MAG: hypothetical protein QN193_02785 [Armatimonadota bacterium]|nr:hypothetical protein [Armatimonadota bacterium]MDR7444098.1 hypothetical protein [Armatimonadota bacterium]MDR7569515.1 hypothetical protein [Armatimonadota bacterium]MDR7613547.1 hypothetical protein [Armatimonadota bacterium]
MEIHPVGPPGVPPGGGRPKSTGPREAAREPQDRLELGGDPGRTVDGRKVRLEALREAILQGRYHLPEDAIARAILRAATGGRHERSV